MDENSLIVKYLNNIPPFVCIYPYQQLLLLTRFEMQL